jgi:hypothetical protein
MMYVKWQKMRNWMTQRILFVNEHVIPCYYTLLQVYLNINLPVIDDNGK